MWKNTSIEVLPKEDILRFNLYRKFSASLIIK